MVKNRVTWFFWPWCLNEKWRECSNLFKYEILAKTNEEFSRKRRKTVKKPYFGDKMLNNLDTHFFFQKSGFVTFIQLEQANLLQKIRKNWWWEVWELLSTDFKKIARNFHEWIFFYNFWLSEGRAKIMKKKIYEWKLRHNF